MAYFAELDENKKVLRVIVADQAFIDSGAVGDPANWVLTDKKDKAKKFAGIGDTYDEVKGKFIEKQPYPSWVLDENDKWKAPKDAPIDLLVDEWLEWDETKLDWVKVKIK